MKINVDFNLFSTLVECLEKQAIVDQQPPEVQEKWNKIFEETRTTARAALNQFMSTNGFADARRTETGMVPALDTTRASYI